MPRNLSKKLVAVAAERASRDRFFVAFALEAYRSMHDLRDDQIASFLGCPKTALSKLALCRRPDALDRSFREDVERIAAYVGADALHLANLLREIDVIASLQESRGAAAAQTSGLLVAARDAQTDFDDRAAESDVVDIQEKEVQE